MNAEGERTESTGELPVGQGAGEDREHMRATPSPAEEVGTLNLLSRSMDGHTYGTEPVPDLARFRLSESALKKYMQKLDEKYGSGRQLEEIKRLGT